MQGVEIFRSEELSSLRHKKSKITNSHKTLLTKVFDLEEFLQAEGLQVEAQASRYAMDLYSRIGRGLQRLVFQALENYLKALKVLRKSGKSPGDSRQLTWLFLKEMNLSPCASTFAAIEPDDIIEIYSRQYIQVFRSLSFFEEFRGPLFDLLILDWMTVFKRKAEIEEQIFLQMEEGFRSIPRVTEFRNIEEHEIKERFIDVRPRKIRLKTRSSLMVRSKKTRRTDLLLITSQSTGKNDCWELNRASSA